MRPPAPEVRPRAVIFDMDGLMLDTEPLAMRAWSDAAAALGVAFDDALALRMVGCNFVDCSALVRAHYAGDYPVDALLGSWHAAYDARVARDGYALKPGLLALLDWLEAAAIPKAVATSTRRERARTKLAQKGLLARFSALVGGDEVARGKPAPDIYVAAAARLRLPPQACVALEDSEPGMRAALAAGTRAIMVPDLKPPPPDLARPPSLVLPDLDAVRVHLAALPR
jgi:HAD superfamily hydrolase (TIGR01509 family)